MKSVRNLDSHLSNGPHGRHSGQLDQRLQFRHSAREHQVAQPGIASPIGISPCAPYWHSQKGDPRLKPSTRHPRRRQPCCPAGIDYVPGQSGNFLGVIPEDRANAQLEGLRQIDLAYQATVIYESRNRRG